MDAETKRTIDEIHKSFRDIQRYLFLLDGCADTDDQTEAVEKCRRSVNDLESQEVFEIMKSFEENKL